ncbi:S8 family serine peptidase [Actinoplanes sp. NPDC024001]|uniref:S8 family peptidase n=1 Tax=Actinoplanes sp. NPDC024001 TaxID=3154598 RepID=UPI0033CE1B88
MTQLEAAVRAATATLHEGAEAPPARFLLLLKATDDPVVRLAEIAAVVEPIGATVRPFSALDPHLVVVRFPGRAFTVDSGGAPFAAAHRFTEAFDLESAEPDLPTDLFPEASASQDFVPEDVSGFPLGCFADSEPALPDGWAIDSITVPAAWAFSETNQRPSRGRNIVVAQPDTGVIGHPELTGITTVPGFDVLSDDTDPTDPLTGQNPGHGTGTASVVVSGPPGRVTGSAPAASHMPIRAINSVVQLTLGTVAEAVDWAVEHGAHVITMSLGGIFSFSMQRALRRAVRADVIVLAAAGNCVKTVVWPARFGECIAVAGVDIRGAKWRGSCSGSAVDIAAPAQNVWRAAVPNGAGQGQGTSFAVALTAGVAALWLAHHGRANLIAAARARGETLQDMFRRMAGATARRPAGWDSFDMGAGIVDARALLAAPNLDLELGRESVPLPYDSREAAALTVAGLAAEEIGPAAVLQDPPDWYAHGPELSWLLLQRRRRADGGIIGEESPTDRPAPSDDLDRAVGNPELRDAVGLNGARPEGGGR